MDCRILRHVTLKSDGHLGCDDSIGYGIDLGHVSMAPGWRIRDVLNGPIYRHIRTSFREGRVPWPGTCEGCDLLSNGAHPRETLDERLELLVEPTLACSLSCACCVRKQIISKGRSTHSLDPAVLERFVTACSKENITIDQVHYIGWGEPLMHGDFRALHDIVKTHAPMANQMVTTAGNVDFRSTVGDAAIHRLVVSCDGATPESYAQYRRGGDFDTVVRFMRDARQYGDPDIYLEWKYILFEHNDSDEHLARAQELADEIGVDSLLFILTNSKWHSTRFTVDTTHQLALKSPVAQVSPAAAMNAVRAESPTFGSLEGQVPALGHLDKCQVSEGRFLTVEGWALAIDGTPAEHVELVVNGKTVARTRTNLRRPDVLAAHPQAQGLRSGFLFCVPTGSEELPDSVAVRVTGAGGLTDLGGRALWQSSTVVVKQRKDLPAVQVPVSVRVAAAPGAQPVEQPVTFVRRVARVLGRAGAG